MKKRMLKQNEWMLRVALDSTYKSFLKAGCQICHIGQGVKSFVWSPYVRTWVLLLWHIYEETWGGRWKKGMSTLNNLPLLNRIGQYFLQSPWVDFFDEFYWPTIPSGQKLPLFFWQNSTSWHEYMHNFWMWPLTAKTFEELRQIWCLIPMDS